MSGFCKDPHHYPMLVRRISCVLWLTAIYTRPSLSWAPGPVCCVGLLGWRFFVLLPDSIPGIPSCHGTLLREIYLFVLLFQYLNNMISLQDLLSLKSCWNWYNYSYIKKILCFLPLPPKKKTFGVSPSNQESVLQRKPEQSSYCGFSQTIQEISTPCLRSAFCKVTNLTIVVRKISVSMPWELSEGRGAVLFPQENMWEIEKRQAEQQIVDLLF